MKNLIRALLCLLTLSSPQAKVIFPQGDTQVQMKKDMLAQMDAIMGPNGSSFYVEKSEKLILWTDHAPMQKDINTGLYKDVKVPSFALISAEDQDQWVRIFKEQTGEQYQASEIGGILVADPLVGAIMYFRKGYLGHAIDDIDGNVSPAVIIYHELSHAKDGLMNPQHFNDMATQKDERYKNKAEKSAVNQQNDFMMIALYKGIHVGAFRQSYGMNKLVPVTDPWQVP